MKKDINATNSSSSLKMTEAEYKRYLERQIEKSYRNDAKKDSNGIIIDGDEYILCGVTMLNEAIAKA